MKGTQQALLGSLQTSKEGGQPGEAPGKAAVGPSLLTYRPWAGSAPSPSLPPAKGPAGPRVGLALRWFQWLQETDAAITFRGRSEMG